MDVRANGVRSPPGSVKVRSLSAVPGALDEMGVSPADVLARAGMPPTLFSNPEELVSYVALGRLLRGCVEATGCDHFGLLVGMRQSSPVLGLVGYVAVNAPTVRAALETIISSLKLNDTGGRLGLALDKGFATLSWLVAEPRIDAVEQIEDAAIAIACNVMRSLCGDQWRPAEVFLPRKRPAKGAAPYLKFFNAPVRFETDPAALVFEETNLDRTIAGRDPVLHGILSPLLEKAMERDIERSFQEEVCAILRVQALNGPLTPDRVAASLGVSVRTLSRRFAAENVTFSELAQRVRFEAAQRLLRTEKSVADVASALGYSDPSAFIRAFKQFSGQTPARWRRSL